MTVDDLARAVTILVGFPGKVLGRLDAIHKRLNVTDDRLINVIERLRRIEDQQRRDTKRDENMARGIDSLTREVRENKDVTESVVALVTGLAERIRSASDDEEALEALAAELDTQTGQLAAAVTANTPVADMTPPTGEPTV